MSSTHHVCVLLDDGRVLTRDGALPAYDSEDRYDDPAPRARAAGDEHAVLIAPTQEVSTDPTVVVSVFAPLGDPPSGDWRALDEALEDGPVAEVVQAADRVARGGEPAPVSRPEWFRTSWYADADAWLDERLAELGHHRTGASVPVKVWSLSAVLRVDTDHGPVWLKAACPHFHAEPALTRLVTQILPAHAPPLLATDDERGWLLMGDLPGVTDLLAAEELDPAIPLDAAAATATLQLRSLDHLEEIAATGLPQRGIAATLRSFDEVLTSSIELPLLTAEELSAARECRDLVHRRLRELDELGLPDTLVHGDLHVGNISPEPTGTVIYDWSDAAVGHPFLDLEVLARRLDDDVRRRVLDAYLEPWRAAYPHVDLDRALQLTGLATTIYQIVTFEQIYAAQEPASYWEMSGVVARWLRELPEQLAAVG